jgi:hypothetical protein
MNLGPINLDEVRPQIAKLTDEQLGAWMRCELDKSTDPQLGATFRAMFEQRPDLVQQSCDEVRRIQAELPAAQPQSAEQRPERDRATVYQYQGVVNCALGSLLSVVSLLNQPIADAPVPTKGLERIAGALREQLAELAQQFVPIKARQGGRGAANAYPAAAFAVGPTGSVVGLSSVPTAVR